MNNNNNNLIIVVIVSLLIGFAGGYFNGKRIVSQEESLPVVSDNKILKEVQEVANPFAEIKDVANPFKDTYENPFAQ